MKKLFYISSVTSILLLSNLNAGFFDTLLDEGTNITKSVISNATSSSSSSKLSSDEIGVGLKDALNLGIKSAIDTLGKKDGFLKNRNVAIPLPENLELIKSGFKKIGKEKYLDELVVAMNRSAEKAVPKTVDIFLNSISKMEFKDVQKILFGADNEATNYFKKSTKDDLIKTLTPIIKESIAETEVVSYYNGVKTIYDSSKESLGLSKVSSLIGEFSSFIPQSMKFSDVDIENFVVSKTMDGVFFMIEEKEKELREQPAMRTTKTLQKVFGELK